MGGSQSGQAEREVTVEERGGGEDGQPQIIVTQDFLQYVQDRQQEEEGAGSGRSRDPNEAQPQPPSQYEEDEDVIPHVTAEDLISSALPGSKGRGRGGEEARFWQRKYQLEREKNAELKAISDNEYAKTVAEVRNKFVAADVPDMLPVCEDSRNEVLRCYHSNPGKPLMCSQEVKAFASCVEKARQSLLQAKQ